MTFWGSIPATNSNFFSSSRNGAPVGVGGLGADIWPGVEDWG
jgi:hypothetical protein